jgi:hypothetical protein
MRTNRTSRAENCQLHKCFEEISIRNFYCRIRCSSLYSQYDNLEKAQTREDKAERILTSAQVSLIAAELVVNNLDQEGMTSSADYEKALLNLKAAQDGVFIATDSFCRHKVTWQKVR